MDYLKEYGRWLEQAVEDDMRESLKAYDAQTIEDAFYRDLSFGTGGLRGIIGAGTNRINVYTVGKASQGLVNYLKNHYGNDASVAIGYDSRIKSLLFAQTAASVFAANGLRVYIWPTLNPVPALSFATRELSASAGVMITASHNPAVYNGYKVYGSDGCQITTEAAAAILSEIEKIDIFDDVKTTRFEDAVAENKIRYIEDRIMTDFIEAVKAESVLFGDPVDPNLAIVYSPLNGTGCLPVTRVLKESGYQHITLVDEQKNPDGYFPTCPYPNPEIREAMDLGITYAQANNADLLLATDPDCDRVGIAVKNEQGDYVLLTGNETGILLLDYICSQRRKHGKMPEDPVMIKTIVSTDLGAEIAEEYGVKTIDVLTGFKFIGEQIGFLEARGKAASYIFGFEESYGYLSGTYVRDKDGVNGAFLICEMFAYYQSRGINLIEKLNAIYEKYGYCLNTLHSFTFEGSAGFEKMQGIMSAYRKKMSMGCLIGGRKILQVKDYSQGLDGLPKSDVLKYLLEENTSVVIRPSGTEPKLKMYLSVSAKNRKDAENIEKKILEELKTFL